MESQTTDSDRDSKRVRQESGDEGEERRNKKNRVSQAKRSEEVTLSDGELIEQRKVQMEAQRREEERNRKKQEENKREGKAREEAARKKVDEAPRVETANGGKEKVLAAGGIYKDSLDKIVAACGTITASVSRESAGKISVTRADQRAIKDGVIEIQQEVIRILARQLEILEENRELRVRSEQEKTETRNIRSKKRGSQKRAGRGMVVQVSTTTSESEEEREVSGRGGQANHKKGERKDEWESEWKKVESTKGKRSYAQATSAPGQKVNKIIRDAGNIQGRVVATDEQGWKTPPKRWNEEIIVRSKGERGARKLAEELAASIDIKQIGGAPRAIRRRKEGAISIVLNDASQRTRMEEELSKMADRYEFRTLRNSDPLMLVSGLDIGMEEAKVVVYRAKLRVPGAAARGL